MKREENAFFVETQRAKLDTMNAPSGVQRNSEDVHIETIQDMQDDNFRLRNKIVVHVS